MQTSPAARLSDILNHANPQNISILSKQDKQGPAIPLFYQTKTLSKVGHAAKEAVIERIKSIKTDEILSNDELDMVWDELSSNARTNQDGEKVISYSSFKVSRKKLIGNCSRLEPFLKTSTYSKFLKDKDGLVSIGNYFNYLLRKVSLLQARLDLSCVDMNNEGFLKEEDLQNYILESMATLNLQDFNPSFNKFYICCAVRKFMFFLDPLKRGKIAIQSILLSPILTEMFELRDPNLPGDVEVANWFSGHSWYYMLMIYDSSMRVYGQFLALDTDHNGMLSRKELGNYNKGVLSNFFLDRLFQECQTYGGEMDFKSFIDFVLAMENIYTDQSIAFCFKLLDFKSHKYLDEMTLRHFLKDLSKKMHLFVSEPLPVEDVLNELFDMANPADPEKITLNDLLNCGVGGTIINILIDCRGFHSYDSRESMEGA